ncbi:hypothetical protein JCM11251_000767 [Rhodosporidiobolus azoricus]
MNFSTFASNLLTSTQPQHPPLFHSTRTDFTPHLDSQSHSATQDDILGQSSDSVPSRHYPRSDRRFSFGSSDGDAEGDERSSSPSRLTHTTSARSVFGGARGGAASSLAAIPAFVTRLGRGGGASFVGRGAGQGQVGHARGWRAYESVVAPAPPRGGRGTYSDDESDMETDEEGPVPGAFLSQPQGAGQQQQQQQQDDDEAMDAPLMGRRTLFVYPVPGPSAGTNAKEQFRDSSWIVLYGLSLLGVCVLVLQAWWTTPLPLPSVPSLPGSSPPSASASVLSTLPTLSLLSLISALSGSATLLYLLFLRRSLSTLLTLSIFVGPFLFVATGVIAFAGSFSMQGVASDAGWKTGVRWFSVVCFVAAGVLGRAAVGRRKGLNRAVAVGELACETILTHPPLIVLSLSLSLLSTILSLPFLSLITSLLSLSPTSPHLASWGTAFVLLVYFWTLAIGRGIMHAVVGGCVGTWYFERDGEGYQGVVEVTKASLARATGPSLGTIIALSFFLSLFTTLSTILSSLSRLFKSSNLPNLLKPLTSLAPLFAALAGWTAWFNAYALSYAGMTGEGWRSSAGEVGELFRANRARNIRDTALLRLTLFLSSTSLGLFLSLLSFLTLSTSSLSPTSGGYAPTLAILSFAIPSYTVRLCHNLVGDAVDALFVCTQLDAREEGENGVEGMPGAEKRCPKAVEAFAQPEAESFVSFA